MRALLAGLVLALTLPAAAHAEERQIWTVTCSKGGRTVYRERIADRPTPSKEAEVARLNPNAVCVMLAPEDPSMAGTSDLRAVLEQSKPGAAAGVLSYASPVPTPQGGGIDAALRALRGDSMPTVSPPLPSAVSRLPVPERIGVEISTPVLTEVPDLRPASASWVRLSLYKDASEDEVLGDWGRIVSSNLAFAPFSPSLTRGPSGLTMLAVGPVSPAERPSLCLAATEHGLDCIAGEGGTDGEQPALQALAKSYPEVVAWGAAPEMSLRTEGVTADGDIPLACPTSTVRLKRPGLDLVAAFAEVPAPPAPQKGLIERISSSSSLDRLSAFPRAVSMRAKARSAPPFIR